SRTHFMTALIAAALSFISTAVNNSLSIYMISIEAASATPFMNSTDTSVNNVLPSSDEEKMSRHGLVVTSNNSWPAYRNPGGSLYWSDLQFHLGLEIKITQSFLVPLRIRAI